MTMDKKRKKLVRQLQALGEGAVTYQTCNNLFLEHGFEEAKRRILATVHEGDAELNRLKNP